MIVTTVLLGLAAVLLILVPTAVFAGSYAVWKIRGATNIVAEWALYDGAAAFCVTVILLLSAAPSVIWPGRGVFGIIPLIASMSLWHLYGRGPERVRRVIAKFVELREARVA
jgi:hypothetical protein